MQLGAHWLRSGVFVAPMAGVTDRPFRVLCRRYGAALAVSEMVSANPALRATRKSRLRRAHDGEPGPVSVQIAGADPAMMAEAARQNVAEGAQLIDINMGCPAKKVCNAAAGSALLADELLVGRILEAVVDAVEVPVTLKIRTGPSPGRRNAPRIARIAESAGVRLLAVHGRTRACGFGGQAEFDTIAAVKASVRIPVIANGDVATPHDAKRVLTHTRADGIMIGRGALGRPWLFRSIACYLAAGAHCPGPSLAEMRAVVIEHLEQLHALYGEAQGVRVARKHLGWYARDLPGGATFRHAVNRLETAREQIGAVREFYDRHEACVAPMSQPANDDPGTRGDEPGASRLHREKRAA